MNPKNDAVFTFYNSVAYAIMNSIFMKKLILLFNNIQNNIQD